MAEPVNPSKWRHDFKNQLGIVIGFSEVLLHEMDETNPHRPDVVEIHTAAMRALDLLSSASWPGDSEET